ncbi:MAG: aminopeptidase P family protein [Desulfobacteraceae bacterium]|nr:MAG: aminopeptidase P family protein [Desulfobacteraceae bacterium]
MFNSENSTPAAELEERIKKFQIHLNRNNIDGALIIQNTDLFYFAGTIQQAHLYIPADGEPLLMVRKSYERAMGESKIKRMIPFSSPKQITGLLRENGYRIPGVLGLETDVMPANLYFTYRECFDNSKLTDVSHLIRLVRSVKSGYELEIIKKAAFFSDMVADKAKELLEEGITEIEFAGKVEAEARKLGHQGIVRMRLWGSEMFYGHIMAGPSAAVPSFLASPTGGSGVGQAVAQGPGFTAIRKHQPVLFDYVFAWMGYLSDNTRIFSIGNLPDELMKAHQAMLDIHAMIKKEAKPGVKAGELYDMATEMAERQGYGENFMGVGDQRIRFVGHGIGLELDEYPFIAKGQKMALEEGMTIAVEPKLVFPGKGVVGIENTHIVGKDGLIQLTVADEQIMIV